MEGAQVVISPAELAELRGNVEVRVTVPGPPVAQGRPRITTIGGFARAYDPAKSRSWKGTAQVHMLAAMRAAGLALLEGPLEVEILAVFDCPVSRYRKRDPRQREWKATKPDAENIAKACLDAGSGVLYRDDAQVALLTVRKVVGAQGEAARVEMRVAPAGAPA